jgi:hypothetical protein
MKKTIHKFAVGVCALLLSTSALTTPASAQDVLDSPLWAIEATPGTWFANDNNTRGFAYNRATNNLLVVSRTGGLGIYVLNASTGEHLKNLNVTGIAGGTFAASLIDVSPQGHIFATNLTLNATTGAFKIYMWENEDAAPVVLYEGSVNDTAARFGDSFRADFTDGGSVLYAGGSGNPNLAKFTINVNTKTVTNVTVFNFGAPNNEVLRAVRGIAPIPGANAIWVNEYDYNLRKMNINDGSLFDVVDAAVFPTKESIWVDYVNMFDAELATVFPANLTGAGQTASIIDLKTGEEIAYTLGGPNSNGNASGGSIFDGNAQRLFVLATNNYIASYDISAYFGQPTSVDGSDELPQVFKLEQNYPNPFNPSTQISFSLPVESAVELSIYSITGQKLATLVSETRAAGQHTVSFDATNLSSGVYLYRLTAGSFSQTNRMTLIK